VTGCTYHVQTVVKAVKLYLYLSVTLRRIKFSIQLRLVHMRRLEVLVMLQIQWKIYYICCYHLIVK